PTIILFFQFSPHPRAPHSFPTRRSSDLIGSKDPVHPNDHVNMGQSSNDVIPSAIHVSAAEELKNRLIPALDKLAKALEAKARERSEEHTSELQSRGHLVCRLLLEKKKS